MTLLLLFSGAPSATEELGTIGSAEDVPGLSVFGVFELELGSIDSAEDVPGPLFGGSVIVELGSIDSAEDVPGVRVSTLGRIPLASIASEPNVPGTRVYRPADFDPLDPLAPLSRLIVRVFDGANALEKVELDERTNGAGFQAVMADTGTGQASAMNDDPDLALVDYLDVLRFEVDGEYRFASLVERKGRKSIDPNEESSQETVLAGRGLLAVLENGLVFPQADYSFLPAYDKRVFNFAAAELDDSGWDTVSTAALGVGVQQDPEGWPDPSALRMWGPGYTPAGPVPVGPAYFRTTFTAPADAAYRLFATGDDMVEVWIDGVPLISERRALLWQETKTVDVTLSAGEHLIAVRGDNPPWAAPEDNYANVLLSLWSLAGPELGTVVVRSDASWLSIAYPASPPGFTAGKAMRVLVEEAQARGALLGLELGFTDDVDSAGNGWSETSDLAFDVGRNLLLVARQLVDEGYVERLRMAPAGLLLDMYSSAGEIRATSFHAPTDELDPLSGNLTELSHEGTV